MMSHGHAVSGVLAGGLTLPLLDVPIAYRAGYVIVCSVFALVPDLDHPSARLGRMLPPLCWLLTFAAKVAFYATRTAKDPPRTNGHRALTHTFAFALAMWPLTALVLWLITALSGWNVPHIPLWSMATMVGCLAHILGDCCTEHGCPILWPIELDGQRWRRLGIPMWFRFKTGKWVEKSLISPLLVFAACTVLAWQVPGVPNLVFVVFDGIGELVS